MSTTSTIEEQYRALREGCGIAVLSWRAGFELLGPDRQRFLHNYVTCDVKGLSPGAGAYGFFTSPQGRILSDARLQAGEERLRVEVDRDQVEPLMAHLRKFILVDRVEIRPIEGLTPVVAIGPRAGEVLGDLAAQPRSHMGAPAWTIWTPDPERIAGMRIGSEALDILRVEAGIPRFGQDFGPDNFPQETGIEEAVSYTKGCYLGQEVVARIHYRGGVQNLLRGLVFDHPADTVEAGVRILHEGREAGRATTVVRSPSLGKIVGLGILHKRATEPGTQVEVEGGGSAEVRELPLVRP
ncbi:MAG TPA: glycine cleavage T C-terminal barrel domain-containing protein [Thermoanaerobaculia bacterium]|jgi:folate-binding protein YgfZ|nr:glycine cleavage T C-terminal barrel domain-containing protein [Thermoanaerobaculia bacterium]